MVGVEGAGGRDGVFEARCCVFDGVLDLGRPDDHCLQRGPYFKDLVLNKDLFGILGPYFHYFGFIHAKNVNSVCMYTN